MRRATRCQVVPTPFLVLGLILSGPGTPRALAQENHGDFVLQMARVDYFLRRNEFKLAAEELGRVPKTHQEELLFREYTRRVMNALEGPAARGRDPERIAEAKNRWAHKIRITRHKKDSNRRADQNGDNRGWSFNDHLEADVLGKHGIRAKFTVDTDAYINGHNDIRYRTLLADFYTDQAHHVAVGDSASYLSPYFLRGSRIRGLHFLLSGPLNEFQAVAGAYPYWLETRDFYIYPREVLGVRDRVSLFDDRMKLGAGVIRVRENEKIRSIDPANETRDNTVYSLEQEIKMIQDVWYIKAAEAYSYTDEVLDQTRFGKTHKLKDTAFTVQSLLIQPWGQWLSLVEQTGPEFRILTDLPSGSVVNSKGLSSDRRLIQQWLDFKPAGPFDLDVEASWQRNDLDRDDNVGETRQTWVNANLGVETPRGWPRPRLRASMIDTVSSPGPTARPTQNRLYDLHSELSHFWEGYHVTAFGGYQTEIPIEEKLLPTDERWSLGARLATTLLERVTVSPHYTYLVFQETFDAALANAGTLDQTHVRGKRHEAGLSNSVRLWDTASLGLSYTYYHGKLTDPGAHRFSHQDGHMGTANFTWPFTRFGWNRRRKVTLLPGVTLHLTDLDDGLERRPVIASRLSLAYEQINDWKLELLGEFRVDEDRDGDEIRTEESRMWLLWSSNWR